MTSILIIVPTLDSYRLLPPLVKSLQEQTLNCWRVVFIDGSSCQIHRNWLDRLCLEDPRFQWQAQQDVDSGIYGAMNQGFSIAHPSDDWILFWGSDDRAASPLSLGKIIKRLESLNCSIADLDLLVCAGRYFSATIGNARGDGLQYKRQSKFKWRRSFSYSLFCGSTPPHQATLIGPAARHKVCSYDTKFRLAADLDYFLRISSHGDVNILVEDLDLVLMGDSGVSAKQNSRRLYEVIMAYRQRFGRKWWIPFLLRYLQRLGSFLNL